MKAAVFTLGDATFITRFHRNVATLRELGFEVKSFSLRSRGRFNSAPFEGVLIDGWTRRLRIMRKNPVIGVVQFAWSFLTSPIVKFARRVRNRFLRIIGMRAIYKIEGLENMVEVSHALTRYLSEHRHSFADCVRRWR